MTSRIIGRIFSVIIIAVLFGLYMHHDYIVRSQMGRDAFLAKEGARFDKFYVNPPALVIEVLGSVILLGIIFCIYELIAFVLSKIFEKVIEEEEGKRFSR